MPYIINKVKNGFKVCKKANPKICFSNKPLSMKQAMKQRTAIKIRGGSYLSVPSMTGNRLFTGIPYTSI